MEPLEREIERRGEGGRLDDRRIFAIALEHLTDREFEETVVEPVWNELTSRHLPAEEVADHLGASKGDVSAMLEWCAEHGLLERSAAGEGGSKRAMHVIKIGRPAPRSGVPLEIPYR